MKQFEEIRKLVDLLNNASDAYYNTGNTIMDDAEFDLKLDELKELENKTGIILSNSPTHRVGAEVKSSINKQSHGNKPMLSLDKCHSEQELIDFAENDDCYIGIKCDGLSIRLSYKNGILVSAVTRGDGVVGQSVLFHIKEYINVPIYIPYDDDLIIDGESVIFKQDFVEINNKLPENEQYKNCRNLAAGTLSGLDANVTRDRKMRFIAWRVIEGFDGDSNFFKLKEAEKNGFTVVPMWTYSNNSSDKDNLLEILQELKSRAKSMGLPMDGAVMAKDSIALSESMGCTNKFFRHSIAYKYEDETYPTKLINIEFTMGKTGILTPTAVFLPVEIDGSTVERASVHNISILTKLDLHIGDTIEIFKANCIIHQVARNISAKERNEAHIEPDYIMIPSTCPICGGETSLVTENSSTVLVCTNPSCSGKLLGQLSHFVSRKAMNIDGMSEATLEFLIDIGWVNSFKDIYHLVDHRDMWACQNGFGIKSVDKILYAIDTSRKVKLENFIASLSIPGIGTSASKTISSYFNGDFNAFIRAFNEGFEWDRLEDLGTITAQNINEYLCVNRDKIIDLAKEMEFIVEEKKEIKNDFIQGKVFCVTGAFNTMKRSEIEKIITERGGKLSGSVSAKTNYLLTNEANSGSSKAKKAAELGTPIMSEQEFLSMIGE